MIDVKTIPNAIAKLQADGLTPGRIITHEWIDRELGLNKAAKDYPFKRLSRVEELRERLLIEHKVDLRSQRGVGYAIVAPEDQTRLAVDDTIRGIGKAIQKGTARVVNVDIAKLTDEGRKENADAIARLASLNGMTTKQIAQ